MRSCHGTGQQHMADALRAVLDSLPSPHTGRPRSLYVLSSPGALCMVMCFADVAVLEIVPRMQPREESAVSLGDVVLHMKLLLCRHV